MRLVCNLGTYTIDHSERVTHGTDSPREELTLERVKQVMNDRMSSLQVNIKHPKWLTYFNVNERMANGFRRDRAFIMGGKSGKKKGSGGWVE